MQRTFSVIISMCFVWLLVSSCANAASPTLVIQAPGGARSTPTSRPTTATPQQIYRDAKLGFRLTVPRTWQAQPQPGSQTSLHTASISFTTDEQQTHALILIGVFQGADMPSAFAAQGTPTIHLGSYPAFVADRTLGEARAPCLVRIFLAGEDYVLADWCAPNAFAFRAQFEQVLATYQPASPGFVPQATAPAQSQTCAGVQSQFGYTAVAWGKQLATPTAPGWNQLKGGAFICSNDSSADWYLFQCTELVNRLLSTRWALPHLPGNAARYYDYYQDGVLHPGTIHAFPLGSYQLSNDASQGKSAFRPVAGDLLIFQDVKNAQVGWMSGLTDSPGHVAMIVGVDNTSVSVAQENYNDTQFFQRLPIHKVANGYEITDLSGWSQRIVRGWIHFTVNGGAQPAS